MPSTLTLVYPHPRLFIDKSSANFLVLTHAEMTAVAIPYDVLDDVLVYLDKRVLLSVCLVNKLLNIAASRVLYGRDITLNPWISTVSTVVNASLGY